MTEQTQKNVEREDLGEKDIIVSPRFFGFKRHRTVLVRNIGNLLSLNVGKSMARGLSCLLGSKVEVENCRWLYHQPSKYEGGSPSYFDKFRCYGKVANESLLKSLLGSTEIEFRDRKREMLQEGCSFEGDLSNTIVFDGIIPEVYKKFTIAEYYPYCSSHYE